MRYSRACGFEGEDGNSYECSSQSYGKIFLAYSGVLFTSKLALEVHFIQLADGS